MIIWMNCLDCSFNIAVHVTNCFTFSAYSEWSWQIHHLEKFLLFILTAISTAQFLHWTSLLMQSPSSFPPLYWSATHCLFLPLSLSVFLAFASMHITYIYFLNFTNALYINSAWKTRKFVGTWFQITLSATWIAKPWEPLWFSAGPLLVLMHIIS